MSKYLIAALIFIAVMLLGYLGVSFIKLSLNPALWGGFARAMYVIFCSILSFLAAGLYLENT